MSVTTKSSFAARLASVPITSSASKPSIISDLMRNAATARWIYGICTMRSLAPRCDSPCSRRTGRREKSARRVEHNRDMRRARVLEQLEQHPDETEDRLGRQPMRSIHRRQRMKRAEDISRAVNQDQLFAFRSHQSKLSDTVLKTKASRLYHPDDPSDATGGHGFWPPDSFALCVILTTGALATGGRTSDQLRATREAGSGLRVRALRALHATKRIDSDALRV